MTVGRYVDQAIQQFSLMLRQIAVFIALLPGLTLRIREDRILVSTRSGGAGKVNGADS